MDVSLEQLIAPVILYNKMRVAPLKPPESSGLSNRLGRRPTLCTEIGSLKLLGLS